MLAAAGAVAPIVPFSRPADHDEVQCALAVAAARWEHGDRADALRWVRRAARAAANGEHLDRALELSRAAAQLARRMAAAIVPPGTPTAIQTNPGRLHRERAAQRESEPSPADDSGERAVSQARRDDDEPTIIRMRPTPVPPAAASSERALPTERMAAKSEPKPIALPAPASAGLTATRVAIVRDASGRPEIMVLANGATPPPGAACALLVACSDDDVQRLGVLLANSVLR